jgi:hypothetical protein
VDSAVSIGAVHAMKNAELLRQAQEHVLTAFFGISSSLATAAIFIRTSMQLPVVDRAIHSCSSLKFAALIEIILHPRNRQDCQASGTTVENAISIRFGHR